MPPQQIPRKKNLPAAPHEHPATTGEPERLGFYHHYHVPTEVPPNTSVAIVHENGGVGSVRLCRNPNPHTHSKETFPGWMARMWKKPPAGDVGSCCVAFWFPALLFGKTDWRLKQASRGGNPQNTAWKAKDGCNGCCWAYVGLQPLVGLDFILIALQRSRIRQVYGIEGSKAADWANAIFCRPCTVLQNDREVRAREGKHDLLSNTEKYKEHQKTLGEMVNTQPCPIQPMSYRSQRSNLDRDRRLGTENIAMEPQKPQAALTKTGAIDGSEDQAPEAQPIRVKSKAPKIVHRSLTHSGDQLTAKVKPARLAHRGSLSGPISPRHENASSTEHALFECSGDGTSSPRWMSKKKKKAGASEISYVHDFTDCAVDKSILDYYERQGRAAEMKQQAGNLVSPSVGARSSSKRPS